MIHIVIIKTLNLCLESSQLLKQISMTQLWQYFGFNCLPNINLKSCRIYCTSLGKIEKQQNSILIKYF